MIAAAEEATVLVLGGLLLGLAFGALVQASHFCIMGALADLRLFGSSRRLKTWLLAIAVAILSTQLLAAGGLVDLDATGYLAAGLAWGPALLGGLLFGFGMVLTGGCASRALVRAAAGSLKAWVVLAVMALAASATQLGLLAPVHRFLREVATLPLAEGQALWRPVAALLGLEAEAARIALAIPIALGLAAWCLSDRRWRAQPSEMATGLALGLLVPAGWLLTGWLAADPFATVEPASLGYVGPVAQSLWLVATGSAANAFAPALVAGTLLGAAAVAIARGTARLEGFASTADLGRHLLGAALMGIGGSLAMGCTIGQGLTGLSTLGAGSLLATGGIVLGAIWALRWLETGRLAPTLDVLRSRASARRPAAGAGRAAPLSRG
ncbi:MAG: YeeE/YedE family protein [Geminicoccaceae bacterium]|nr:YeeE/YedE family protein [Geminicoccaceae bacterium]